MPNNGSYPNFGEFSQTLGVNAKILGFYTLGTHYSWGYPNFVKLPKTCYLDVGQHSWEPANIFRGDTLEWMVGKYAHDNNLLRDKYWK